MHDFKKSEANFKKYIRIMQIINKKMKDTDAIGMHKKIKEIAGQKTMFTQMYKI